MKRSSRRSFGVRLALCGLAVCGAGWVRGVEAVPGSGSAVYRDGWIDFNKNGRRDVFEDAAQATEKRVEDLLGQMTLDEKTCQLATLYGFEKVLKDQLPTPAWKSAVWKDGIANIDEMHNGYRCDASEHAHPPSRVASALNVIQRWFIEETRLGIPVDFTNEGIRGVAGVRSTNFPAQIGLGASWDRDLVARVGEVTAAEARALGYTHIYAPIMDLARDPRWGRVPETYGEDPHLVAELGIRMASALQKAGLAATAKHFAVYSEPKGGRDGQARTDPHVAPREMEMLHLWPWERLVREAGILGVMSSYNDYDGVPVSGGREFLIERLRTLWGFRGYVVSDSDAVPFLARKHRVAATVEAAAGMFVEEGGNVRTEFVGPEHFVTPLRALVKAGKLSEKTVDDRVRDVLRVKFLIGLFDRPFVPKPEAADAVVHSEAHREVALRAARASLVLLKNDGGTLPFRKTVKRVLVTGPTSDMEETSIDRYGSTRGEVTNVREGVEGLLAPGGTEVVWARGAEVVDRRWPESELYPEPPAGRDLELIAEAVALAKGADAVVVAVGDSNATIGESKSRTSLELPGYQNDLVKALVATGKPVAVVLLCGRPATVNWIARHAPAVLSAWFPGEAGGRAIAEALFGEINPGGKLPVTFPRSVGQVPFNFPYKPGSQAGQSKVQDPNGWGRSMAEGALYTFGHGLSYTTFAYDALEVAPASVAPEGEVTVACSVRNAGPVAGDEVVQLYVQDVVSSVTTYDQNLCGFERVRLEPGETRRVTFKLPASRLWLIDREGRRTVEPGEFKVMVGGGSADIRLTGTYTVTGGAE
jgi:beta-glucosidase